MVHLLGKTDIMWLVRSVRPVMDPSAPPGTVELALEARFVTGVLGGRRITDVIKVMDAEETEALNKQMQGAPGATPDAPPALHVVGDGGVNGTPQGPLADAGDDEPGDDEPKES